MRHLLLARKYTQLHWIKNECFLLGDPFCSGSVLYSHCAHSAPSYHHPCAWWSFWRSTFYWNQTCFRRIKASMNYNTTITRITNLSWKLQVHVRIVLVVETIKIYAMNLTLTEFEHDATYFSRSNISRSIFLLTHLI